MSELEERMRNLLSDDPNVGEKRMFGGIAFMLNGNMLCGVTHKGRMMLRVGKEQQAEVLAMDGAEPFDMTGKPMGGMVIIDETALETDAEMENWIAIATRFVGSLPPK